MATKRTQHNSNARENSDSLVTINLSKEQAKRLRIMLIAVAVIGLVCCLVWGIFIDIENNRLNNEYQGLLER